MKASKDLYKNVMEEIIPAHKFLGMQLVHIEDNFAKVILPFREEFVGDPRIKRWHGGLISLTMDAVGGAAGLTTLTSYDDKISTVDIRVDYLRPSEPKDLIVEGHIIRSGNRIIVTKMTAYHPDEKDKILAEGRGVYNVRRMEPES